jgi:hypothetical protein
MIFLMTLTRPHHFKALGEATRGGGRTGSCPILSKGRNMFEIIKDAPKIISDQRGRRIYPFPDMQVGDSFDAPDDIGENRAGVSKRQNSICACIRSQRGEKRFVTQKMDGFIRCQRTA